MLNMGLKTIDRVGFMRRQRRSPRSAGTTALLILTILCCPAVAVAQSAHFSSGSLEAGTPGPALRIAPQPAPGAASVEPWLYAVDDGRADGSSTLYRLGITPSGGTVALERIGETGIRDIFDIGFMGNRLFGVGPGTSFATSDDVIVELDPRTGAVISAAAIDPGGNFNALVGESASTLLATTSTGNVWRINPDALTATQLGSYGGGTDSSGDLARARNGAVYGTVEGFSSDELARIDLATGRARVIGRLGYEEAYGLAFHPSNGTLLGVVEAEDSPRLVSINTNNGSARIIGRIPTSRGITGLAVSPLGGGNCPPGHFQDPGYPDFCFRVRIGNPGNTIDGARESSCLPETVCVSGAVPGRSELFLRILGPRPNGYLWPTIIRFTPSRLVVDIHQRSTNANQRYVLPAVRSGDPLTGIQDRTGFRP